MSYDLHAHLEGKARDHRVFLVNWFELSASGVEFGRIVPEELQHSFRVPLNLIEN